MNQPLSMTVKCQDPRDGSGGFIVNLPPEVLNELGVTVSNQLSIELIDGVIVLKPVREATPG